MARKYKGKMAESQRDSYGYGDIGMNSENKMPDNLSGVLLTPIVEADQEETKN